MANVKKMNAAFWKDRKVLVTGATGIVGSWLVKDLLDASAEVTILVLDANPQSELYRSKDINETSVVNGALEDFWTVERAINQYEIDTVFHLGAQTIVDTAYRFPLPTLESNIRGTYNLLEACRIHKDLVKRIVIASSDKAYGEQTKLPYTEQTPLNGRFPYEVSKSCADLIAQSYFHTYQLPLAIARCGNIYGGGDLNWSRIVPGTIRSFLRGERPAIRSNGKFIRDYIYVKDISRAYMSLAQRLDNKKLWGEAFNFSSESPLSVLELVAIIQKLMKCEHLKPRILDCAKGEIPSQYLSSKKAQKILKWKSEFDFESGLSETIDWYNAFLKQK